MLRGIKAAMLVVASPSFGLHRIFGQVNMNSREYTAGVRRNKIRCLITVRYRGLAYRALRRASHFNALLPKTASSVDFWSGSIRR